MAPRLGGVKQKKSSWGSVTNNTFLLFHSRKPRSQVWISISRKFMFYSKSFQSGRIQPKSIVKNSLLIAYAGMQIWIYSGCGNDCFIFQIIDSFIGGTLDLAWLSVSHKFYYEMAFVCSQNIREPKQRPFWATHFNRKWGHFPFHMPGRQICILIETICPKIWPKPPPQNAKSLLPVDVRRFKLPIFDPSS